MKPEIRQSGRFRIKGTIPSPSLEIKYYIIIRPQDWAELVPSVYTHFIVLETTEVEIAAEIKSTPGREPQSEDKVVQPSPPTLDAVPGGGRTPRKSEAASTNASNASTECTISPYSMLKIVPLRWIESDRSTYACPLFPFDSNAECSAADLFIRPPTSFQVRIARFLGTSLPSKDEIGRLREYHWHRAIRRSDTY